MIDWETNKSKERFAVPDLQIILETIMRNKENSRKLEESAGPHPARTEDNPVTTENIGLPTGIQPDEISRLDEVKPAPEKTKNKS